MEQIAIRNLTFAYDRESAFSLKNVSLEVSAGEMLLIIGESGCGKTTLLKHLKPAYLPAGFRSEDSEIRIKGKPFGALDEREQVSIVGFVNQYVEASQVTDKVWHELAFGLESLGYEQDIMQRKVAEMVAFFGLENIYHERLCNLSGGQRQLVNLASVMAMEPEILVLDEPTSQLDPIAAADFFHMIEKINKELGTTILMTEHRLEEVFSLCDRVCVMEKGRICRIGTPQMVACELYRTNHALAKALPMATRLYFRLDGKEGKIPLTVNEGRSWLENYVRNQRGSGEESWLEETLDIGIYGDKSHHERRDERKKEEEAVPILAKEIWFRYEKEGRDILKACSLELKKGKITAILGGNGTGKSTLLHVLAGHYQAYMGDIRYYGKRYEKGKTDCSRIGIMPQNPQAMFAKKTVEEELMVSAEIGGKILPVSNQKESSVAEWMDFCGLQSIKEQHPFDISGGEMQRLALAKLLLEKKDVLLLDEPSKGMDAEFKEKMGRLLCKLAAQGKTILMVSHDVEFCASYADMCGLFFDGRIVSLEDSRMFFQQNRFYTTSAARMCRGILPQVIGLEDVTINGRECATKEVAYESEDKTEKSELVNDNIDIDTMITATEERGNRRMERTGWLISAFIVFAVMPVTIYIGHAVLLQRKYYFISLLLVLEATAGFFLRFEKRKPKVREIMIVAMMSAIVVAGRAAFYMIPNVKPMAALVIVSGIGLGAEAGFLVGSTSMLISNIFFGQGPWTPWQMFACGMLGFLSGIVFRKSVVETCAKKLGICIYGFLSVVLIYGGILNPASVFMYQESVNWKMILTSCVAGLPYDLIHGVATFAFLWVGCKPLLEKLERVREKAQFLL